MKILIVLNVNGMIKFKECQTADDALKTAKGWETEAKKEYPAKDWKAVFYTAEQIK